jgi:hypothetical protein
MLRNMFPFLAVDLLFFFLFFLFVIHDSCLQCACNDLQFSFIIIFRVCTPISVILSVISVRYSLIPVDFSSAGEKQADNGAHFSQFARNLRFESETCRMPYLTRRNAKLVHT